MPLSGKTKGKINLPYFSSALISYTFDQISYEKDTRKLLGKSLETRILEKHNGEWKIVYLGYHYFPDTLSAK